MCIRSLSSRAASLSMAAILAVGILPLDVAPAEAGRFNFRYRSSAAPRSVGRADEERRAYSGLPYRFRFRNGSGSGDEDEKGGPKQLGAAAAAAARAHAALEAERSASRAAPSMHDPLPMGKTVTYDNGVTCVAGC